MQELNSTHTRGEEWQGYSATKRQPDTQMHSLSRTQTDKKPHERTDSKSVDTQKNPPLLLE